MGGSGHIREMNRMLKDNRENRRSKRKGFKDSYVHPISKKALEFNEPSPDKLQDILRKIKKEKKREKEQTVFILIFSVIFVIFFFVFDYLYLFS